MKFIVDLASEITFATDQNQKAPAIVLGAPKNRLINEIYSYLFRLLHGMSENEADVIAIKAFKEIGDYAHSKKTVIVLEVIQTPNL